MALPFEQQDKESDKAFEAFTVYLGMGVDRSLEAAGRKLGKSTTLMERWSRRWNWTDRVAAHSAHLAVVERESTEVLARGKAAEWLRRQQELREREWSIHEKCIAAAERGLKAFMEREKVYANLADIARMLEVASKLGRLASGLATDKQEVTGEEGGPVRVELSAALQKIYGHEEAQKTQGVIEMDEGRFGGTPNRTGVDENTSTGLRPPSPHSGAGEARTECPPYRKEGKS